MTLSIRGEIMLLPFFPHITEIKLLGETDVIKRENKIYIYIYDLREH